MNKVINITPNGIKQAIDDLVNENEMLQDKVYKLESIIKEVKERIEELVEDDGDFIGEIDRRRKVELLEILDKGDKV